MDSSRGVKRGLDDSSDDLQGRQKVPRWGGESLEVRRLRLLAAVRNKSVEEVKQLIDDGMNVSFEGEDGTTPLGVAVRLAEDEDKDAIVEALGDQVVEDSLKELKQKLQTLSLPKDLHVGGEQPERLSPNFIDAEKAIVDKVESALDALNALLSGHRSHFARLIYKNVNIFVLFLEAFTLQDVKISKILTNKRKSEIINQYFGKDNYNIIKSIRTKFTHRDVHKEILGPMCLCDIICLTQGAVDVENFFCGIRDYAQGVYDELSGQVNRMSPGAIQKLLKPVSTQKAGECGNDEPPFTMFRDLIELAYSEYPHPDELEKGLFNLTVNIIPMISRSRKKGFQLEELLNLRNDLIHNFHKFRSPSARLKELKRAIFNVRSKLFKYYASRLLFKTLTDAKLDQSADEILGDFGKELTCLQEKFRQELTLSETETKDSFEHVFSKPIFSEKLEDIGGLVSKYLKFMAIFDDEMEKDRPEDEHHLELTDVDRREIFEDFVSLKGMEHCDTTSRLYRKDVLSLLVRDYGIDKRLFDKVISLFVEGNDVFKKEAEDKITSIVKGLMSLKHWLEFKEFEFRNQDIVSVFDRFTKEKGVFRLSDHKDLLRNYGLPEKVETLIDNRLMSLVDKNETIDIENLGIRLNVAKVVNNILRTFYNSYNKYRVKFDDMEGAFSDRMFVDFLVSQVPVVPQEHGFRFEDKYFVFTIIKKLLKVKYTAPFIVSLITQVPSESVIEQEDVRMLMEISLRNEICGTYLAGLLSAGNGEFPFNLYEVMCAVLVEDKVEAGDALRPIIGEPKLAREVLHELGKYDFAKSLDTSKQVLKLLNDEFLRQILTGQHDSALELLGIVEDCVQYQTLFEVEVNDDVVTDHLLNVAKLKNALGEKHKNQGRHAEAGKLFYEAIKTLDKIPEADSSQSYLALSRRAYTHTLLKNYEDSYYVNAELYQKVVKYSLGADAGSDHVAIYNRMKNSKNYQALLSSSGECKKYLSVPNIRKSLAFSRYRAGYLQRDPVLKLECFEEALRIYMEVFECVRREGKEEYRSILPIRRKITTVLFVIGGVKSKFGEYQSALEHNLCALEEQNFVLEKEREIFGSLHQYLESSREHILVRLKAIASIYTHLGGELRRKAEDIRQQVAQFEQRLKDTKVSSPTFQDGWQQCGARSPPRGGRSHACGNRGGRQLKNEGREDTEVLPPSFQPGTSSKMDIPEFLSGVRQHTGAISSQLFSGGHDSENEDGSGNEGIYDAQKLTPSFHPGTNSQFSHIPPLKTRLKRGARNPRGRNSRKRGARSIQRGRGGRNIDISPSFQPGRASPVFPSTQQTGEAHSTQHARGGLNQRIRGRRQVRNNRRSKKSAKRSAQTLQPSLTDLRTHVAHCPRNNARSQVPRGAQRGSRGRHYKNKRGRNR